MKGVHSSLRSPTRRKKTENRNPEIPNPSKKKLLHTALPPHLMKTPSKFLKNPLKKKKKRPNPPPLKPSHPSASVPQFIPSKQVSTSNPHLPLYPQASDSFPINTQPQSTPSNEKKKCCTYLSSPSPTHPPPQSAIFRPKK